MFYKLSALYWLIFSTEITTKYRMKILDDMRIWKVNLYICISSLSTLGTTPDARVTSVAPFLAIRPDCQDVERVLREITCAIGLF